MKRRVEDGHTKEIGRSVFHKWTFGNESLILEDILNVDRVGDDDARWQSRHT